MVLAMALANLSLGKIEFAGGYFKQNNKAFSAWRVFGNATKSNDNQQKMTITKNYKISFENFQRPTKIESSAK